jgi:hypothetical protein
MLYPLSYGGGIPRQIHGTSAPERLLQTTSNSDTWRGRAFWTTETRGHARSLAQQLSSIEGKLSEPRETTTGWWDNRVRRLEEHRRLLRGTRGVDGAGEWWST